MPKRKNSAVVADTAGTQPPNKRAKSSNAQPVDHEAGPSAANTFATLPVKVQLDVSKLLGVQHSQVVTVAGMFKDGDTVPFISRYALTLQVPYASLYTGLQCKRHPVAHVATLCRICYCSVRKGTFRILY